MGSGHETKVQCNKSTCFVLLCLIFTITLQLGHGSGLPESPPPNYEANDDFLKAAHHVLLEVLHCGPSLHKH